MSKKKEILRHFEMILGNRTEETSICKGYNDGYRFIIESFEEEFILPIIRNFTNSVYHRMMNTSDRQYQKGLSLAVSAIFDYLNFIEFWEESSFVDMEEKGDE